MLVMTPDEVRAGAHKGVSPQMGEVSYWLQPKDYARREFRDRVESITDWILAVVFRQLQE